MQHKAKLAPVAGERPLKISDLYGHDLKGWQVATCYFLAIFSAEGKSVLAVMEEETDAVVVLHQQHLWEAWKESGINHKGMVKAVSFTGLVNPELRIVFNMNSVKNVRGGEAAPVRIFLPEDISVLQKMKKTLSWHQRNFGLS